MYALSIQNLIRAFAKLPGVGKRTAERFVFSLLKFGKKDVIELTLALKQLTEKIKSCEVCWNFSDQSPCRLCSDKKRNAHTLCVVAEPQDLERIESLHIYTGQFHVLRGVLNDMDEAALNRLTIQQLLARLHKQRVDEIIFALNPNLDGENTLMYLEQIIKKQFPQITSTRLARGLPMGSDLEYADEITLGNALKNRTKIL